MKVPRSNSKIVRQPLNDVRNLKTSEDTPNIKRNLRQRKVKNYRDSSLNNNSINKSKSEDKTDRVPVYLKSALNEDEKKEKDPFEFIYDTPEAQKKKNPAKGKVRKQQRLQLGSKKGTKKSKEDSWSSDSSFHIISRAVKRAERKKFNSKAKSAKPDKNANHCMIENNKRNLTQTQANQVLVNVEKHTTPSTQLNSLVIEDNYLINRLMESSQFKDVNKNEISTHKVNDKSTELTNVEKKKLLDLRTKLVVQNNMNCSIRESFRKGVEVAVAKEDDQFFGFDDENEDLVFNNLSNICSTPSQDKRITAMEEPNASATLTDKFKSLTSTPVHRTNVTKRKRADTDCNKIKILSNIVLPPPRLFKRPQPNQSLNETQQNETLGFVGFDNSNRRTVQRSPWRNDNNSLVRNPHFLQMKNNFLPCYNQEMVLDERLERSIGSKTPKPSEELNKSNQNLLQTSIIDYFNSSSLIIENSPAQKITNQTLFDNDQLSPLKNKSVLGQNNGQDRAKRNILGPLNNIANVSLVKDKDEENLTLDSSVENYGVEKCFGFDDEDKENKKKKAKVNTKKMDKVGPTRYSLSELKKVREAALQDINVGEIVDQDVSVSIEPIVEALPTDEPQEEEPTVGLFEDLIEIPDRKSYSRKRPRRVRIPSFQAEEKIVENDKQKRKKRDVRTKSEEEKLNNWAAEFNAMCDEVNQHELETV